MRHDGGEFACDGAVHVLHYFEVGGEEDVEVAWLDLFFLHQYLTRLDGE